MSDQDDFQDDDDNIDDNDPQFNGIPKGLRDAARAGKRHAKENETLKAQVADLQRQQALTTAGLNDLSEAKRKALLNTHDGDLTAEALKQTAIDLGFIDPPKDPAADQDVFVNASKGSAGNAGDGTISPDDVAEWSNDKRRDFLAKHPDEFAALMRNEKVRV